MAHVHNSQSDWRINTFFDRLDEVRAKHMKEEQAKRRKMLAAKENFRKKLRPIVSAVKNFMFGG